MASECGDGPSDSTVKIAANGDVILVIDFHRRSIQVNSVVLGNASKYFNAMFGLNFSEGQDLKRSVIKEIPMPDDNAVALEVLFNIIHLRNHAVPEYLKPNEVFELAVVSDKFDCAILLKHASMQWLRPKTATDILEMCNLMAATYILDNARAFMDTKWEMIFRYGGS
tara:strand:- start:507 stop:1010 length:504 start_codon:yes stop_codon:yes gene_type:complete